jgi:hypothetical protein
MLQVLPNLGGQSPVFPLELDLVLKGLGGRRAEWFLRSSAEGEKICWQLSGLWHNSERGNQRPSI